MIDRPHTTPDLHSGLHSDTRPDSTRIAPATGEPQASYPKPERLVTGNPRRDTWEGVSTPLAGAQRLHSGVWRCEPGRWRIAFGPSQQEVFTVLEGLCRVHTEGGDFKEVGPGEALHIPAGFRGEFEVIEAVLKTYVTVDAE